MTAKLSAIPLSQLFYLFGVVLLAGCRNPEQLVTDVKVDKDNAFNIIREIVSIGGRASGSSNASKTCDFIFEKCVEYGYRPEKEEWTELTPAGTVTFRNVYATISGRGREFVILGSHYDTKKLPNSPAFVGANDSASSTALLLEIMRTISTQKWRGSTIKCAFFDGEEAYRDYSQNDGLHGSRRLASKLKETGDAKLCKAMVLLDMIGDRDLTVTISPDDDQKLIRRLFAIADRQKTRKYFGFFLQGTIIDDHVPFKELGIPALDIIDMKFGPNNSYWHTDQDTVDKLSANSLKVIGDATLALLMEL